MKFPAVVTPPYIYHGWFIWKMFCEEKFTPVKMRSCGHHNVRKHKEINNSDKYISLDVSLQINCLDNMEVTSSG